MLCNLLISKFSRSLIRPRSFVRGSEARGDCRLWPSARSDSVVPVVHRDSARVGETRVFSRARLTHRRAVFECWLYCPFFPCFLVATRQQESVLLLRFLAGSLGNFVASAVVLFRVLFQAFQTRTCASTKMFSKLSSFKPIQRLGW